MQTCVVPIDRSKDETWTATSMTRSHDRSPKDERLCMGFAHGHRKTATLLAGLLS